MTSCYVEDVLVDGCVDRGGHTVPDRPGLGSRSTGPGGEVRATVEEVANTRVTVLAGRFIGAGTPRPDPDRFGRPNLLDLGGSACSRLADGATMSSRGRVRARANRAVFFTHTTSTTTPTTPRSPSAAGTRAPTYPTCGSAVAMREVTDSPVREEGGSRSTSPPGWATAQHNRHVERGGSCAEAAPVRGERAGAGRSGGRGRLVGADGCVAHASRNSTRWPIASRRRPGRSCVSGDTRRARASLTSRRRRHARDDVLGRAGRGSWLRGWMGYLTGTGSAGELAARGASAG